MIEHSLYDVCLCADFGGNGYDYTATIVIDAVSDTTLVTSSWWGARTGDCGSNSNGNLG